MIVDRDHLRECSIGRESEGAMVRKGKNKQRKDVAGEDERLGAHPGQSLERLILSYQQCRCIYL